MTPEVSLVLVCYHSAAEAAEAVGSFRAQVQREGLVGEVVLVDHSQNREQLASLARLEPERLVAQENRGYAAGLNRGINEARGRVVLAGNPDIRFREGSVSALLAALAANFDVVGPCFVLEDWRLPLAEPQDPLHEVLRMLASQYRAFWRVLWQREVERSLSAWAELITVPVAWLSGALLAFPRDVYERIGPFPEGYFLYFEETEWLLQARRQGARLGWVGDAQVEHRWAHAARGPEAEARMRSSRRQYYRNNFGLFGKVVALWDPRCRYHWPPLPPTLRLPYPTVVWLLSPSPLGLPAAGVFGNGEPPVRALEKIRTLYPGVGFWLGAASLDSGMSFGLWRVA